MTTSVRWNSSRGRRGAGYERAFKYAFVLALGLAFGSCIHAPPNLEEVAKLARLDEINVLINKAVARLKPQAAVFAVDPASAARVAEALDYRIAEWIGSVAGWRSFLAVHGSGVHAQTATGEVEGCFSPRRPPRRRLLKSQMTRPLLRRVGKDRYRDALAWPGAQPMEMRGRTMEGYVYIDPPVPTNDALKG